MAFKDRVLLRYVSHLASHEELWQFVVLYASLLPTSQLLDHFPAIMVRVQGKPQRQSMLTQMRELFASGREDRSGLDLALVRLTVQLIN